ncbi:MAG TPA: XRE family transcriptional regulator [Clostridiales bacterium]|nr:XRE family transcriptional regulator [Clostridiales bacterium]
MSTKRRVFIMKIIVAERIRELMKEENLTQVALAAKVGVKQNTISAWLLEKKEPSIRSLWLLADYFGVDIDFLVGRKDI